MLAVAVAISSYATMDRHFPAYLTARIGTLNAEAVVVSEGGTVGDVSLGRYSTIIKPVSIPTSVPINRAPITYAVAAGESLPTIASRYGVTVSQIRWSNTNLIASDSVATGQQVIIPPVPGIVVTTKATDTFDNLGAKYQVDPQTIIDFNRLRSTQLTAGTVLVIPGGVGGAFPPPPAIYQIVHTGSGGSFNAHTVAYFAYSKGGCRAGALALDHIALKALDTLFSTLNDLIINCYVIACFKCGELRYCCELLVYKCYCVHDFLFLGLQR